MCPNSLLKFFGAGGAYRCFKTKYANQCAMHVTELKEKMYFETHIYTVSPKKLAVSPSSGRVRMEQWE